MAIKREEITSSDEHDDDVVVDSFIIISLSEFSGSSVLFILEAYVSLSESSLVASCSMVEECRETRYLHK